MLNKRNVVKTTACDHKKSVQQNLSAVGNAENAQNANVALSSAEHSHCFSENISRMPSDTLLLAFFLCLNLMLRI